jgi:threonine/homoserine/homoserine lactone efflux protein
MEVEVLILTAGILGGISSSAPLGIINLWITDAVLSKNEHKITWFIVGVIIADAGHAAMASWGYHEFLQEGGFDRWIGLLGGAFIAGMGLWSLRPTLKATQSTVTLPAPSYRKAHEFGLGLMMCGLNPGFLVFWMFIIDQIEKRLAAQVDGASLVAFLSGIIVGDILWFSVIIYLARKGRAHVDPKVLKLIRSGIAASFVALGVFAMYRSFMPSV